MNTLGMDLGGLTRNVFLNFSPIVVVREFG